MPNIGNNGPEPKSWEQPCTRVELNFVLQLRALMDDNNGVSFLFEDCYAKEIVYLIA